MTRKLVAVVCCLLGVVLGGCVYDQLVWQRFDGQSVNSSPAFAQQAQVAFSTCKAIAINAANGVPQPAYVQPAPVIQQNVAINTVPGGSATVPYQPPPPDMSGFANLGNAIATARRRDEAGSSTMEACMNQRGYRGVMVRTES